MKIPRIIIILVALVILLITSRSYQTSAFSFHFVDEEDNLVLGKYLLQGETLYRDVFSHHQPLAYIMSAGVQKLTSPNSIYLLIKKHREVIILWAVVWSALLVARFGWPMLLTVAIVEPIKIFLLGHLFLSESLVIYPFIYLLGWFFLSVGPPKKTEAILLGFCLTLTLLLLSPLWPVIFFLLGTFFWQKKLTVKNWSFLSLGTLLPVVVVLFFINLASYFHDAFYINFKYYIPMSGQAPLVETLFSSFLAPITAIFSWEDRSASLQVTQLVSVVLILNWAIMLRKKMWKVAALMFLTLGLINLRYVEAGQQSYSGFHLLPWFASLVTMAVITVFIVWQNFQSRWWRLLTVILLMVTLIVTIQEAQGSLFVKRDKDKDFYINYSRQTDFGQAVKIMKSPEEKLMVVPDEWLIYWQADIGHASKMVNYYAWMSKVSEIRDPLYQIFTQNPPTYLYCDCKWGYFGLEEYFPKYTKLIKDGQETNLMVLKDKLPTLTQDQKDRLSFFNFEVE